MVEQITEEEWKARFIRHMTELSKQVIPEEFQTPHTIDFFDVKGYAEDVVEIYIEDRNEYNSPEEAAETDIAYWGEE